MDTITSNGKTVSKTKPDKNGEVRIAIVEDDPMYRHAIEYYLEKIPGNRLFSFGSGEECLKYYHLLDPEIMILDYRLHEMTAGAEEKMNGLDVLHEVKSIKPEMEIIFLSGQDNLDVATSAIKGGATQYIFKDFNALTKLQNEVSRLSMFVRMKREELSQTRLILYLLTAVIFLLVIAYFSGSPLAFAMKLLIASTAAALFAYFTIVRKKKKISFRAPHFSFENNRPGIWHD